MRIHSDSSYLPPGVRHVAMLDPFWESPSDDPNDPTAGRLDRYRRVGKSIFEMVPLRECEAAILPIPWETTLTRADARTRAEKFLQRAREAGKTAVVFFCSDADEPLDLPGTVIFRTSFYRSLRRPNEFAMPAWSEDLVERYLDGRLILRRKAGPPVVGFCGFSLSRRLQRLSLRSRLRRVWWSLRRLRRRLRGLPATDATIRARALEALAGNPAVRTNFLLREEFWGKGGDPSVLRRTREEYVRNLVDSDYILCGRGAGNFSYRLYEALLCGRIPIFLDTDCVLPFEDAIDWKRHCVWVDEREAGSVADRVASFHASLSDGEFEERQRACRRLWEEWLSPEAFFARLAQSFPSLAAQAAAGVADGRR